MASLQSPPNTKPQLPQVLVDIVKLALVALLPALIVGSLLFCIGLSSPIAPREKWGFYLADILIAAPLIETALMFPVLWMLKKLRLPEKWLPHGSAAFWAILHALKFPPQGLKVAWPFFVFGRAILKWDRFSRNRAYLFTALIHSLFNAGIASCEILFWFKI